MTLLTDVQAVVSAILGNPEIGRPVTIKRATAGSTDPVAGTVTPGTPVEIPANAYFYPISIHNALGGLVQQDMRKVIIDAELAKSDIIIDGDDAWQVLAVNPIHLGPGTGATEADLGK